jgi:hypothetical protein
LDDEVGTTLAQVLVLLQSRGAASCRRIAALLEAVAGFSWLERGTV